MQVGVQICYDGVFPEGCRILALKGADIVFNPTNYATYGQDHRVRAWGRLTQSRAYKNAFFVCVPNKADVEQDRENVGRWLIISPLAGEILATGSADQEEVVSAEIDLDEVLNARKSTPFWRDRRPEVYRRLIDTPGIG